MALVGTRHAVLCGQRLLGKKISKSSKHNYMQELDFTFSFRKVTRYTGGSLSIRSSDLQSKGARTTDELIIVVDSIIISTCRVENVVRDV